MWLFKQPVCWCFFGQTAVFSTHFDRSFNKPKQFYRRRNKRFIDGNKKFLKKVLQNIIMFWLFGGKKDVEKVKEETKQGFDSVKKDITAVSGWIKHLDSERNLQQKDLGEIKEVLSSVQEEVEGLKNILSMMNQLGNKQVFKTPRRLSDKQTAVYAVQTGVQTAVQTPNLEQFSITERAILWVLLNTDMRLSYDDLAAMLGKERSTVRGQINSIKQKSEGLLEEVVEANGKKRVYIPEEIKEKMLKKTKVRVKETKKSRKSEKNRVSEY